MSSRQDLLKKWAPILEHEGAPAIKDQYRKEVTAILLENQERKMQKQSHALFEAAPANAGGTGIGVYQAAADEGKFAIGVDSNQNYLQPGTMLTPMVKRVGVATLGVFKNAEEGSFTPGIQSLGLKESGVDWALDSYNRDLISPELETKISGIKAKIVSGEIKVHDYMSDNTCTY